MLSWNYGLPVVEGGVAEARRSAWFRTVAVMTAALFCLPGTAVGYRFYSSNPEELGWIVTAEQAKRWSGWEPGETLEWTLDTSAAWSKRYGSLAGIRRVVERALAAWSDLPHADISWELAHEAASDYGEEGPQSRDAHWVSIDPSHSLAARARIWSKSSDSGWRIISCSVLLGDWALEAAGRDLPADSPGRTHPGLSNLIHEFGHCLGLAHSQRLPTRSLLVPDDTDDVFWRVNTSDDWVADPQMSYGWRDRGLDYPVTADDAVGAALLRPAPGWQRRTGSISGSLNLGERPVPHAHVWAFPAAAMAKGERPRPVGAFGDDEGQFLIEGLAPGWYVLWASPITERRAHLLLLDRAGASRLGDAVAPWPVRVEAGSITEAAPIPVRERRE